MKLESKDKDKVLVTGGSGFVATYCIAALLRQGRSVRATVRSHERERVCRDALHRLIGEVSDRRLEFAQTDLDDDSGWQEAVLGCRYVLHVASPVSARVAREEDLVRPAREGTLRVLRAARRGRVQRVVMTSSTAAVTYGRGSIDWPASESTWSIINPRDTSAYERAKLLAEQDAWAEVTGYPGAPELTTLCPGAVLGPAVGDHQSESLAIVKKLIDGSLPAVPRFGWSLVDVRDLADLHLRAMLAPEASGQRYIAAGPFIWMSDIADMLRRDCPAIRDKVPTLSMPGWLVRMVALVDPVVRGRLFELNKRRAVSDRKAWVQLGWSRRPYTETLIDTVESLVRAARS